MKRTVQMKKAGVPDRRSGATPTTPRRDWRKGEVVNHFNSLSVASAVFATHGAEACAQFLGSKSKFQELSPRIQARISFWQRAARRMEEMG
jgi:hypothetical protein